MSRSARRPLAGRVVAITGGARGIGAATARRLEASGARVTVGDLDPTGDALPLDVTERESFAAFLDAVEGRHGPLDVLVNNAGVMHVGPFLEEPDEWTRRQLEINLQGPILGMKLALPRMLGRGAGHVVNVASLASRMGVPGEAVYSASKFGLYGVTEAVRRELGASPVELSVVMPGLVRTQLAAGTLRGSSVLAPEQVAEAIARVLERPRFDVYVPAYTAALDRLMAALPRSPRDAALRALGVGRNTESTTREDRAAYEDRVAALARERGGRNLS